ncbi:MAG: hypothetical protein IPO00_07845 [Betaproteobacteria bacterium]|nr:hypothetical protein [Betaproteobacteria bacterium]
MIASGQWLAAKAGEAGNTSGTSNSGYPSWCSRSGFFVFLAGLGFWLLSHPYWGIWHDARVYTLMAVRWIDPAPFLRDPWFMFGSQDSFSLFSPLYGSAIKFFGVNAAAKWGSFLAGLSFVLASWFLSRALPLGRRRDLVFLILVSVQLVYCVNDYGLMDAFRVSESFITSRQFAVSLGMLGVAAAMVDRPGFAAFWLTLSLALHPLMGLWAVVSTVFVVARIYFRTAVALVVLGSAVVLGLSIHGAGIFQPVDGEWGELVRETSRIVFVATDSQHRIDFALICYSVLLLGACWGQEYLRRWYKIVLLVSVAAYAVNWFCSSFFPAAIVMQAQLWRANWFALVLAVVAAADLSMRVMSANSLFRYLAMAAGSILVLFPMGGALLAFLAACCPNKILVSLRERFSKPTASVRLTLRIVSVLIVAILGLAALSEIQAMGAMLWRVGEAVDGHVDFFRGLVFLGGFGFFALAFWFLAGRPNCLPLAGVVSLVILALGLWQWDSRPPLVRQADEKNLRLLAPGAPRMFADHLRVGDVVYWQGKAERVWFELRTASYASGTQAIGIVFSEKMALAIAERLGRVALAATLAPVSSQAVRNREDAVLLRNSEGVLPLVKGNDLHGYEAQTLTIDGLKYLCEDPELDFVIHDAFFPAYVKASITETEGQRPITWNLYDCGFVRQYPTAE